MNSVVMKPLNRREWLSVAAATSLISGSRSLFSQDPDRNCEECGGLGFLPLKNRKPYFHVEGQAAPKPADAVPHRFCPKCQPDRKDQELVDEQTDRLKNAAAGNKQWEKEAGYPLTRVESRHVTVHAQVPLPECIQIGQGFENYAAYVQNLTGTMELTRTSPANYEMICLLGQEKYEHFRTVLEKLWSVEERGPAWSQSRGIAAFDHEKLPFFYETLPTLKQRPPVHGVCFMGGRRQLNIATNFRASRWLAEGYAEFSEFVSLKRNLWRTIYNMNPGPEPGDWVSQVRQLAMNKQLRPWEEQIKRDLSEWDARDYLQTFGMVAFLLQTEPKKFLSFTRKLRAGTEEQQALEEAYEKSLAKLDADCTKWLITRGR
jgi:hypothetical protein